MAAKILNGAKENNLVDIEATDVDISKLYNDLSEMKGSMMTKGVHVAGTSLKGDELVDYVLGIVRFDRGEKSSVQKCLALANGLDWEEIRRNPSKVLEDGKLAGVVYNRINEQARALINELLVQNVPVKKVVKKYVQGKSAREAAEKLEDTLDFALALGEQLANNREIDCIISALNAEYITPGREAIPSGVPA